MKKKLKFLIFESIRGLSELTIGTLMIMRAFQISDYFILIMGLILFIFGNIDLKNLERT